MVQRTHETSQEAVPPMDVLKNNPPTVRLGLEPLAKLQDDGVIPTPYAAAEHNAAQEAAAALGTKQNAGGRAPATRMVR